MDKATIQDKQNFLRAEVIEGGIDPDLFMDHMGRVKGEGANIELENWSMEELQSEVKRFKIEQSQFREEVQQLRASRDLRKSKIFEVPRKEKVKYEEGLWDYEVKVEQECAKSEPFFKVEQNSQPAIKVEESEVVSVGGFIFGIGAHNELRMRISSNITQGKVIRKGEDCDWLRKMLIQKHVGCFVPPLEEERQMSSHDQKGINARVVEIQRFLNSLLKYPVFQCSRFLRRFLDMTDSAKFHEFKSRQESFAIEKDIDSLESPEGSFTVEVSQRINSVVRNCTSTANQINGLYSQIKECFEEVALAMDKVHNKIKRLSEVSIRIGQGYGRLQNQLKADDLKIPTMMLSLNNTVALINKNIKRHSHAIKKFARDFVLTAKADWEEMVSHGKRVAGEMKSYLSFKENLLRKKEKYYEIPAKWQLPELEYRQLMKKGVQGMSKDECFSRMFPGQNQNQGRQRIWLAFVHHSYLSTYQLFLKEQEGSLMQRFLSYSAESQCLSQEVKNSHQAFREMIFE